MSCRCVWVRKSDERVYPSPVYANLSSSVYLFCRCTFNWNNFLHSRTRAAPLRAPLTSLSVSLLRPILSRRRPTCETDRQTCPRSVSDHRVILSSYIYASHQHTYTSIHRICSVIRPDLSIHPSIHSSVCLCAAIHPCVSSVLTHRVRLSLCWLRHDAPPGEADGTTQRRRAHGR